MNSALLGL